MKIPSLTPVHLGTYTFILPRAHRWKRPAVQWSQGDGTSVHDIAIFRWTMLTHHILTCNWVLSDVITKATPNSSDIARTSQGVSIGPVMVMTQTQRGKGGVKVSFRARGSECGREEGWHNSSEEAPGDYHKPSHGDRAWLWSVGVQGMVYYMLCRPDIGLPWCSDGKETSCNAGDLGSIPGLGRSPGGGHGNPLQYSCLENPHGQRSLVGYSPKGHKESGTTEWLSTA